jgi:hypothetical protein
VGRAALDEDAIRLIEQLNPGVDFEWTRILKGQGTPATEARPPADVRRQRPRPAQPSSPAASQQRPAAPPPQPVDSSRAEPAESEVVMLAPEIAVPCEDVITPAHGRIGSEGVQRLRARYAEILVRISERAADPQRQLELKAQAERLNPDAWVTDEDVTQGLEQYESVLASLREVVGQRRRRRRRGKGPRTAEPAGGQAEGSDSDDSSGSEPEFPSNVSASGDEGGPSHVNDVEPAEHDGQGTSEGES